MLAGCDSAVLARPGLVMGEGARAAACTEPPLDDGAGVGPGDGLDAEAQAFPEPAMDTATITSKASASCRLLDKQGTVGFIDTRIVPLETGSCCSFHAFEQVLWARVLTGRMGSWPVAAASS